MQGLFIKQTLNSHSNVLRVNRNAGVSVSHGAVSSSVPALWRPWVPPPGDAELTRTGSRCEPRGSQQTSGSKGALGFQHPVRLYLPLSKRQEYLQSSGEKVLASFPVQATIHFYNDESESDSEEEQEEETQPKRLQSQEAAGQGSGPGGKGRGGLASL